LISTQKVSFTSIDSAFEIFDIPKVIDLVKEDVLYDFKAYKNGSSEAPTIGDLLIFSKQDDTPFGHVAVVADLNIQKGFIAIAEQNINQIWENSKLYSRRLGLDLIDGNYYVSNSDYNSKKIRSKKFNEDLYNRVVGWKRVIS